MAGCIACVVGGKKACSLIPKYGKNSVRIPYSNAIGKCFHGMQIIHWMCGTPLNLWIQNFDGVNFLPGIRSDSMPLATVKREKAKARAHAEAVQKEWSSGSWPEKWYGVPYQILQEAYQLGSSRAEFGEIYRSRRCWSWKDTPAAAGIECIRYYFSGLSTATANPGWRAADMYKLIKSAPSPMSTLQPDTTLDCDLPSQRKGMTEVQQETLLEGVSQRPYINLEKAKEFQERQPSPIADEEPITAGGDAIPSEASSSTRTGTITSPARPGVKRKGVEFSPEQRQATSRAHRADPLSLSPTRGSRRLTLYEIPSRDLGKTVLRQSHTLITRLTLQVIAPPLTEDEDEGMEVDEDVPVFEDVSGTHTSSLYTTVYSQTVRVGNNDSPNAGSVHKENNSGSIRPAVIPSAGKQAEEIEGKEDKGYEGRGAVNKEKTALLEADIVGVSSMNPVDSSLTPSQPAAVPASASLSVSMRNFSFYLRQNLFSQIIRNTTGR